MDVPAGLDAAAVSIPLAQAIGRFGNWFNQELYGRPTTLPWGLRIDPEYRPLGRYADAAAFHPTFLYEALWNLALIGVLLALDRTKRLKQGKLFSLYVAGYGLGRLWVESFRIDEATEIWGLRVNTVMSLVAIAVGVSLFASGGFRDSPERTAARLAQRPWPESQAAQPVVPDDRAGEAGPEVDGPAAEGGVTETDQAEADHGIDPDEDP
jgi:prolipoprotein diacylglyceryltransferase